LTTVTSRLDAPAFEIAAAFVEQFRALWAAPSVEGLDALMHPDVCYTQPLLPAVIGRERTRRYWRRIFTLIPDLHLNIANWAVSADNAIYIEFQIKGTLGRTHLSLPAIDRYELDGAGRVRRRTLYCDSLPVARALLRPRGIAAVVRAGMRIGFRTAIARIRSGRKRGR